VKINALVTRATINQIIMSRGKSTLPREVGGSIPVNTIIKIATHNITICSIVTFLVLALNPLIVDDIPENMRNAIRPKPPIIEINTPILYNPSL
jgi:hypothetical protein